MMNRQHAVQFIEQDGKPEWAVLPYTEYLRLCELQKLSKEVLIFRDNLANGREELVDEEYANRLIEGENPVKAWRNYRKITQTALAKAAQISPAYLSQIGHNERTASVKVLTKIADILQVLLDDLM